MKKLTNSKNPKNENLTEKLSLTNEKQRSQVFSQVFKNGIFTGFSRLYKHFITHFNKNLTNLTKNTTNLWKIGKIGIKTIIRMHVKA